MPFSITLSVVIIIAFILDTFILVPKDVNKWSFNHIFIGDKSGYVTKSLKLSYTKIKEGQLWRLISEIFLHVGIPHIFFNLMALLIAGYALETTIGTLKTAIGFIFSSIVSSLIVAFCIKHEDGEGASTGIYGLIAMYILVAIKEHSIMFSALPWYFVVALGIYTVVGMFLNKIDAWEHSTGALGGLIFGAVVIFVI